MNKQFKETVEEAAEKLGMSVERFKRTIFDELQEQYDKEDITSWLEDNGHKVTKKLVNEMFNVYRHHYDSEYGTWDNIASAY